MDGTGILFKAFVGLLPGGIDVRVVAYPEDEHLSYVELADRVRGGLPRGTPYVIIAESYSGPVASILAAHPIGNLQAVVFVSSFVALPGGRIGPWIATVMPTAVSVQEHSAWILDGSHRFRHGAETGLPRRRHAAFAAAWAMTRRLAETQNGDLAGHSSIASRTAVFGPGSDRSLEREGFADSLPHVPARNRKDRTRTPLSPERAPRGA